MSSPSLQEVARSADFWDGLGEREEAASEVASPLISPRKLFALRALAVIPIMLAGIFFYDSFAPAVPDKAVVTSKNPAYRHRQGTVYLVQASGSREYNESVSKDFYDQLRAGDVLELQTTPVMRDWREATQIRGGNVVGGYQSYGVIFVCIMACSMIIVPALAFTEPHILTRWKELPSVIFLFEFMAAVMMLVGGYRMMF